jgi:hypothetical protein
MSRYIVGLTGRARSGKSEVARIFREEFSFGLVRFAGPLKKMMAALGLSNDEINGDMKETPSSRLNGKTPRYAMQTLGTEWGRDMISPTLWIDAWRREADLALYYKNIIADDVRFANEAEAVRTTHGTSIIIRVERGMFVPTAQHASEIMDLEADTTIVNNGTLENLRDQARLLAHAILTDVLIPKPRNPGK